MVSAPAKRRSERSIPSSAPRYMPSRSTSSARCGPMLINTTRLPAIRSFRRSACSRAFRSSGLHIAGRALRSIVPSAPTFASTVSRVSVTCFTSTAIFKPFINTIILNILKNLRKGTPSTPYGEHRWRIFRHTMGRIHHKNGVFCPSAVSFTLCRSVIYLTIKDGCLYLRQPSFQLVIVSWDYLCAAPIMSRRRVIPRRCISRGRSSMMFLQA